MEVVKFTRSVFYNKKRYAEGERVVPDEIAAFFKGMKHRDGTPFTTTVQPKVPEEKATPLDKMKKAELQAVYHAKFGVEASDDFVMKELIEAIESDTPFDQ